MKLEDMAQAEQAVYTAAFGAAFAGRYELVKRDGYSEETLATSVPFIGLKAAEVALLAVLAFREVNSER